MIFVTVGNAIQSFRRLLNAVDLLAGGLFDDQVVWIQSGNNPGFHPLNCQHIPFLSPKEFDEKIRDADLVICHAGAGTLFHVFQLGKLPVVMPRQKKHGELVDDHQLELVETLAAEGRIVPVYEPDDLPKAIQQAMHHKRFKRATGPTRMLQLIEEAMQELATKKCNRLRWVRNRN